jgi:hypothetical protein
MQKITGDKAMSRDRFNELMKILCGFQMGMRFGDGPSSAWRDQKNMFQNFHFLEDRMFECCQGLFFPKDSSGCYVLDDKLVSSKATAIEVKTLSSRKSGKEGSTVDAKNPSDTQEENVKQLVSLLPRPSHPYTSPSTPMIAFNWGYGKMNMINYFLEKQFKIITVCTAVGSGHPYVSESDVKAYVS